MARRTPALILALLSLFLLASCAQQAWITIPYTFPPELDIPPDVKTLGVVPFGSPKTGGAYDKEIGIRIAAKIEEHILGTQYYRLIDRTILKKLLAERQLSFADFSEGGQKDLKLKGVDAIITGKVTRYHFDRKKGMIKQITKTRVYNRILRTYVAGTAVKSVPGEFIEADMSITFRMVNTKTGVIIAVKEGSASWQSRGQRSYGGKRADIPTSELPDRGKVMTTLLDSVNQKFIKLIAPHVVTRRVQLVNRGPDSERGFKLATNKLLDKALKAFQAAAAVEQPPDGAYYNQGVMLEALGRLKEAEKAYEKAYELNPDMDLYIQALRRLQEVIEKQAKQ